MTKPMALVGRKHDALHRPSAVVVDLEHAKALADRMFATLTAKRGLALAAPQVGHALQLVVLWDGTAIINPTITGHSEDQNLAAEACLTIPGRWYEVPRYDVVTLEASNLGGGRQRLTVDNVLHARMWQHELDHLNGLLLFGRYPEVRRG